MRRYLIFLITLLCTTLVVPAQNSNSTFHAIQLTVADGLPSNTVRQIIQDKQGFIWLATTGGLSRYDGYSFVNFSEFNNRKYGNNTVQVASLQLDEANQHLWVNTSAHIYTCYDLATSQIVNYTDSEVDGFRTYEKEHHEGSDMWLFDGYNGIRHINCIQGELHSTDFVPGKQFPKGTKVKRVISSMGNGVYAVTDKGLFHIDAQNHLTTSYRNTSFIEGCKYEKGALFFTENNQILVMDKNGKLIKAVQLPTMMGRVKEIPATLIWNGEWLIFTPDATYALNLNTYQFSKPQDLQIPRGRIQGKTKHYTIVANEKGQLVMLGKDNSMQKPQFLQNIESNYLTKHLYHLAEDSKGSLFVAVFGYGLYLYNPHTHQVIQRISANDEEPIISSNFIQNIYIDRGDNIWLSSETAGVFCISQNNSIACHYYYPRPNDRNTWGNRIYRLFPMSDGNIMFSTKDNKCYLLDTKANTILPNPQINGRVFAFLKDRQGHEWTGTRGNGLYIDKQLYQMDDKKYTVPINDFFDIVEDKYGRIWIATWQGGLLMTRYQAGKPLHFKQYLAGNANAEKVHDLEIDRKGNLWIATANGLYRVDAKKKKITKQDFQVFNTQNGQLPNNEIVCVMTEDNGNIWLGTTGSGVLRCRWDGKDQLTHLMTFDHNKGISSNIIKAIVKDANQDIWISTEQDISVISPNDKDIKHYSFGKSQPGNVYAENAGFLLKDRRLIFGTEDGLVVFNVAHNKHQRTAHTKLEPSITDVKVNGISLFNMDELAEQRAFAASHHLKLSHQQNSVTLYFSNFDFSNTDNTIYQYYMEGIDKDWRPITSLNYAEYSEIQPGHYTFHVRTSRGGQWIDAAPLSITVMQPWYNSWWAWLIYMMIAIPIAIYLYRQWKNNWELKQKIEMEEQMNDFRINFFTNITHEFRTPLAVIQNAVNRISNSSSPATAKAALQTATRGSNRLLRLVNQLIEFRRLSTGNMKLAIEQDYIIRFVKDIYQDLWNLADHKDIKMTITTFDKSYMMLIDKQKVETMVYNIISNAIKYTPQNGCISVKITKDENRVLISVEDDGPGITAHQQENMFQPFMHGYVSQGGMGIGLYSARQMALLHHGDISYQAVDPHGSIFTVSLPTDENVYQPEDYREIKPEDDNRNEIKEDKLSKEIIRELMPEALNHEKVVIIEDDVDMMEQIKTEVSVYFNTTGYLNGKEGYEGVINDQPDLIICDVMLPDMNGYDIVKKIKADDEFANIPVIMLTALDDDQHQMKGYQAGADDYMVKPCNFNILIARSMQLINWAKKHEAQLEAAKNTEQPVTEDDNNTSTGQTKLYTSIIDKNFKERLDYIISQHIGDSDFNIDTLAGMMQLGHTKFYGKMKEITGASPNKYLMNERMRIAAQYLLEGQMTISEISYKVGFQDQSYFNRCFKQKYGTVPSKYGK